MKSDVVNPILCISTVVDERDPYVLTVERIISHQKMKALPSAADLKFFQ